ncbi:MAG: phosphate signaling complex protein PhoU [Magnetococcales bacterium]|nr:phosphate signaling complex protein PhoU [Magnetococcales bacterium]NGZ25930.1 phosphate signaling complex protein PhoU [Magnetococcales bacterium]
MPIYEEKLQKDITAIKSEVVKLGNMVQSAVNDSVTALFSGDEKLANMTVLRDFPINRQCAAINKRCHNFIARHLPSAGHLRMITSIIQMVMELERMGDYARTISREVTHMHMAPEGIIRRDLETMANHVRTTLQKSMEAFASENIALARATMVEAAGASIDLDVAFQDLAAACQQGGGPDHVRNILDLHTVAYMLERVSNRATNVCEETVFILTGETPPTPIHNIVFLDGDDATLGPMAEVIAKKGYASMAFFRSAARTPAASLNPAMVEFMRHHGYSLQSISPKGLDLITPEIHKVNILISLNGSIRNHGLDIPFHTAVLEWDLGEAPGSDHSPNSDQRFEEIYRSLSANLANLMELLCGEEGG